jgi:hypothetical protein
MGDIKCHQTWGIEGQMSLREILRLAGLARNVGESIR